MFNATFYGATLAELRANILAGIGITTDTPAELLTPQPENADAPPPAATESAPAAPAAPVQDPAPPKAPRAPRGSRKQPQAPQEQPQPQEAKEPPQEPQQAPQEPQQAPQEPQQEQPKAEEPATLSADEIDALRAKVRAEAARVQRLHGVSARTAVLTEHAGEDCLMVDEVPDSRLAAVLAAFRAVE